MSARSRRNRRRAQSPSLASKKIAVAGPASGGSPVVAGTRSIARQPRVVRLSAYYDAAATGREQDYGSFTPNWFEDFQFTPSIRALTISRLRREVRNNPYLAGLVNKFPEAVGFSNLRSRTSDRDYNDAKDLFWYRWSRSITASGDSLRATEDLVKRELLVAGEVFFVLLNDGRVQLIPSEFCGSARAEDNSKGWIAGIHYNERGRPIAYRFGRLGGSGTVDFENSEVVDARNVIHVWAKDRVFMGRGLPWLLPSLRSARDLYEITRAKTKQIKDANSISGTIEAEDAVAKLLGMGHRPEDYDTGEAAEDGDSAADPSSTAAPTTVEISPGTFIGLEPGEKLNQLKSEYEATDYKELIMLMLHAISAPIGLPVELWFSGLGEVNFSGFKGLGTQWSARRSYITSFLEDKFLNRLQFWRVMRAQKVGELPANPDEDESLISWAWRRVAVLDDEREGKANKVRLENGEVSVADLWEEQGLFAEEVLEARRQLWIKLCVAAGELDEDVDPSTVAVPKEFLLRNELPGGGGDRPIESNGDPAAGQGEDVQ